MLTSLFNKPYIVLMFALRSGRYFNLCFLITWHGFGTAFTAFFEKKNSASEKKEKYLLNLSTFQIFRGNLIKQILLEMGVTLTVTH